MNEDRIKKVTDFLRNENPAFYPAITPKHLHFKLDGLCHQIKVDTGDILTGVNWTGMRRLRLTKGQKEDISLLATVHYKHKFYG